MKGVSMIRVTYRARAYCVGDSNGGDGPICSWERQATMFTTAAEVRSEAQRHVKASGHSVLVDIIDRTDYTPEMTA